MKTVSEIRRILQDKRPYLAEKYGVAEIGLFGSYVRGEQREDSDLDILMEHILTQARRFVNADAGSIYIAEDRILRFTYTQNDTRL